jgi:hypothetical protein
MTMKTCSLDRRQSNATLTQDMAIHRLSLRLPDDLHQVVGKAAKEARQSMNNFILSMLDRLKAGGQVTAPPALPTGGQVWIGRIVPLDGDQPGSFWHQQWDRIAVRVVMDGVPETAPALLWIDGGTGWVDECAPEHFRGLKIQDILSDMQTIRDASRGVGHD